MVVVFVCVRMRRRRNGWIVAQNVLYVKMCEFSSVLIGVCVICYKESNI